MSYEVGKWYVIPTGGGNTSPAKLIRIMPNGTYLFQFRSGEKISLTRSFLIKYNIKEIKQNG
jgi:hypothetical protein